MMNMVTRMKKWSILFVFLLTFWATGIHAEGSVAGGIILVSTIDGYLTAVDVNTGVEKWKFKEDPLLEPQVAIQRGFTFIANPRDEQLYLVVDGKLSRLPFTISDLALNTRCMSDGIIYSAEHQDVSFSINLKTGERSADTSNPPSSSGYCPASNETVVVFKREYHVSIYTKSKDHQWSTTITDYFSPSHTLKTTDSQYSYQHFTCPSNGRLMTVDASTGDILWNHEFDSVIVKMYLMNKDGIYKLPSIPVSGDTFEGILQNANARWTNDFLHFQNADESISRPMHLFPALFVGQTRKAGLFALPAFVESSTMTGLPKFLGPPLLEGPSPIEAGASVPQIPKVRPVISSDTELIGTTYKTLDGEYLLLGYHNIPPVETLKNLICLRGGLLLAMEPHGHLLGHDGGSAVGVGRNQEKKCVGNRCIAQTSSLVRSTNRELIIDTAIESTGNENLPADAAFYDEWMINVLLYKKMFLIQLIFNITLLCVLVYLIYWIATVLRAPNRNHSISSSLPTNDASRSSQTSIISYRTVHGGSGTLSDESGAFELPSDSSDEWVQIGKLRYNRRSILGKGCSGTFVYEGMFDNRKVAVKRIIKIGAELFHREVHHLRESDSHVNVIRYFCSESDLDFHYIALELCEHNLDDYVQKEEIRARYPKCSELDLLKQTSDGIAHLHTLKIVHRDVKPKNILISSKGDRARVLISDFGLCKAIQIGQNSISKTGIAGTEGWMAPEVIENSSVTCAVDVFSLGCVFYYILSGGDHPFGGSLYRQDLILRGAFNLRKLIEKKDILAEDLIEGMLQRDAKYRPTAHAVAMHPLFWSKERQLSFLMDVSDRTEKELDGVPAKRLEENRESVVGRSWFVQLSKPLQENLMVFRNYKHHSICDLLRAMRNKKHHYRELPDKLRESLGHIPEGYITYFTSKFPGLLIHVYTAMTVCADESVFVGYYPTDLRQFYERRYNEKKKFAPPRRSNWYSSPEFLRRSLTPNNGSTGAAGSSSNSPQDAGVAHRQLPSGFGGAGRNFTPLLTYQNHGEAFNENDELPKYEIHHASSDANWRASPRFQLTTVQPQQLETLRPRFNCDPSTPQLSINNENSLGDEEKSNPKRLGDASPGDNKLENDENAALDGDEAEQLDSASNGDVRQSPLKVVPKTTTEKKKKNNKKRKKTKPQRSTSNGAEDNLLSVDNEELVDGVEGREDKNKL